mgnify:CR=1 FL=1
MLLCHHRIVQGSVVPQMLDQNWDVTAVLNSIATADPPYHALIDTGALITGMSNFEVRVTSFCWQGVSLNRMPQVARYLLEHGLSSMQGVVFLDELDRKMILVRAKPLVLLHVIALCGRCVQL